MHLLADIGGTNARFRLCGPAGLQGDLIQRRCADFRDVTALLRDALAALKAQPKAMLLAVAGPVDGDVISMTNLNWRFSRQELARAFNLDECRVINDFAAIAWGLRDIEGADLEPLGGGAPRPDAAKVVLGPGTGLGVAALVPTGSGWAVVAGEGGHASLAARNDQDAAILRHLRHELGHVSQEAVLSGPGLVRLYRAIVALDGSAPANRAGDDTPRPEAIGEMAAREPDGAAARAIATFSSLLGSYAGDLALIFGARGGVYLAGGVLPNMGPRFDRQAFRRGFEAKGPLADYVAAIPGYMILAPTPALTGLARLAKSGGNYN